MQPVFDLGALDGGLHPFASLLHQRNIHLLPGARLCLLDQQRRDHPVVPDKGQDHLRPDGEILHGRSLRIVEPGILFYILGDEKAPGPELRQLVQGHEVCHGELAFQLGNLVHILVLDQEAFLWIHFHVCHPAGFKMSADQTGCFHLELREDVDRTDRVAQGGEE